MFKCLMVVAALLVAQSPVLAQNRAAQCNEARALNQEAIAGVENAAWSKNFEAVQVFSRNLQDSYTLVAAYCSSSVADLVHKQSMAALQRASQILGQN